MSQIKPLYIMQRQLQYRRHRQRLSSISKLSKPRLDSLDSIIQMHRIRNKSMVFRTHKKIDYLNQQNDKIVDKLLQISRKRSMTLFQQEPPHIQQFYNPARKKQQQEILNNNRHLADRILSKQSEFDSVHRRRDIQKYEQVKRMMEHNKRVSLPLLQPRSGRSMQKSRGAVRKMSTVVA